MLLFVFCLLNDEPSAHLVFNTDTDKNYVTDSAENLCQFGKKPLNDSLNMFVNKSEGIFLLLLLLLFSNVGQTCSYGLKVSRNIENKYLLCFKAYFQVLDTFHKR